MAVRKKKKAANFDSPQLFINRELSWLEFNRRVLLEGMREDLPLLERLKFLAIFSSNLDEFFLIRVAGLAQMVSAGLRKRDKSGLTPNQQLARIGETVHELNRQHTKAVAEVITALGEKGLCLLRKNDWTLDHKKFVRTYFQQIVMPVLTPLDITELAPRPLLPGLQLYVALVLEKKETKQKQDEDSANKDKNEEDFRIVVIPVPSLFERFVTIPSKKGTLLTPLEDVIADNAGLLCAGEKVEYVLYFRLTRDADVSIQEDEAEDLLGTMEEAVLERKRRGPVRLEISAECPQRIQNWFKSQFNIDRRHIYQTDGLLDAKDFWQIVGRSGYENLRNQEWSPRQPRDLLESEDIWQTVSEKDVLMFHPYESFEPVVEMLREAAEDPDVLAIKQTLYRTSGESPIIASLEQAAENGKEVTVLVELKARFDETRNIRWARRLEDAGCHVIYGVLGLKTHSKALLIVRREGTLIKRYFHLATGNYNDKTAKIYSDIGLMSSNPELASDVAAFFNMLTGFSETVGWNKLTIAPAGMRKRFIELIEREIDASSPDRPGLIMAKVNSLEDKEICQALYRASAAGVKIRLNVRGICCLRPGVKGVSEKIEVVSIIDRFLEHARIYHFNNAGHPEVYLSSADWMGRNLDRRLETLFPVTASNLKTRLIEILKTFFADNIQSYILNSDGTYIRKKTSGRKIRAQKVFYEQAENEIKKHRSSSMRFHPVTNPRQ